MPYPMSSARGGHGTITRPSSGIVAPPLPAFDNVVAAYGLNNFNPVGYPTDIGVTYDADGASGNDAYLTGVAPYPLDWENGFTDKVPPYRLVTWYDQNPSGDNDLIQSGAARPTLQVTTPVVVSGAGTAAANAPEVRYFGQVNERAAFVYEGSFDPTADGVYWDGGSWNIQRNIGDENVLCYSSTDDVAFPWLATFTVQSGDSPAPTVAAGPQSGQIETDGIATCLQSSGSLVLGTGAVFQWYGSVNILDGGGVILEVGNSQNNVGAISLRGLGNSETIEVTISVRGVGGINSKTYDLLDTNNHLFTVIVDTTNPDPSLQIQLKVDGVAVGVAGGTFDLAGLTLLNDKLNVGARDNGDSQFLATSMQLLQIFDLQSPSVIQEWIDRDLWVVAQ